MALPWHILYTLDRYRNGVPPEDVDEHSHPSNILLQIVLPMVLILAFLINVQIQILEQKSKDLDILKGKIMMTDRGTLVKEYQQAIIELQRQTLLVAFEKVKKERRQYFGVALFAEQDIEIRGDSVFSRAFKISCERTYRHLNHVTAQKNEIEHMYVALLDSAKIQDPSFTEFESEFQVLDHPEIITNANRTYIENLIRGFTLRLVLEARNLQYASIERIFEHYLFNHNAMDALDPELKKYREGYNTAESDEIRRLFAQRLHNRLLERLAQALKKQGYQFFDDTWQRMYEVI